MLVVGPSSQKLFAHRWFLERTSAFFHAAFKNEWKEGQELQVNLVEEDVELFKTYLHYTYTRKIPYIRFDTSTTSEGSHKAEYIVLAGLYCLGEKYQDTTCRNAAIDAIIAKSECRAPGSDDFPPALAVDIIYRGTCAGSRARKLMVDLYIGKGHATWLEEGGHNHDFLIDLERQLLHRHRETDTIGDIINNDDYYG